MARQITFTVAHLTGQKDQITIDEMATVAQAKAAVEQASKARGGNCPARLLRLVFAGRQLEDKNPLMAYEIPSGAKLFALMRAGQAGALARGTKQGLQQLLDSYEITIAQSQDLNVLANYDTVFLLDDSGSMMMEETTAGVTQSRWKELQGTVKAMIEFATFFDDDGTDIHFLNRPSITGVTDPQDGRVADSFAQGPRGGTPLNRRFREVVSQAEGSKPLLVVLATDGCPSDGTPADFVKCCQAMMSRGRDVRLAVMACTQRERDVAWLNKLDDDPRIGDKVDVCDDYEAERDEVLATGRVSRFLMSDYYLKAMLGPILAKFDNLDQWDPHMGTRKGAAAINKGATRVTAGPLARGGWGVLRGVLKAQKEAGPLARRRAARPASSRGEAARPWDDAGDEYSNRDPNTAPGRLRGGKQQFHAIRATPRPSAPAAAAPGVAGGAAGAGGGDVVRELTRLFVLHRAGALDAAQFAAAKAAVLGSAAPGDTGLPRSGPRNTRKGKFGGFDTTGNCD